VNSDAAVKLTTRAFAELNAHPEIGRAEALRRSMVELINYGPIESAHPAVWAPFVLVGEGGNTQHEVGPAQAPTTAASPPSGTCPLKEARYNSGLAHERLEAIIWSPPVSVVYGRLASLGKRVLAIVRIPRETAQSRHPSRPNSSAVEPRPCDRTWCKCSARSRARRAVPDRACAPCTANVHGRGERMKPDRTKEWGGYCRSGGKCLMPRLSAR
jgi:hypothetical protein